MLIQQLIYILKRENCGLLQYMEEAALILNKHINIHHTSKKGCKHISPFKRCCQESLFFIQAIEILDGSGYYKDGELDKYILTKWLDGEDFWIKTL